MCLLCFVLVLCSGEEAKKRIYNVSCERYLGFGCEIDEETSTKLEGLVFTCTSLSLVLASVNKRVFFKCFFLCLQFQQVCLVFCLCFLIPMWILKTKITEVIN